MSVFSSSTRRETLLQQLLLAVPRHATAIFLMIFGLGFLLRLLDITRPFYGYHMWNEVYYVTIARNFEHFGLLSEFNYDWLGGANLSQRFGPAPFVPWLIYLSSKLFGTAEWAARLPILILSMFSLLCLYYIARELYDRDTALIAVFLGAVMPGIVFLSRQIALDGPMTAFGLAAFWTALVAQRRQRYGWLILSAILLGIAIFIKYTAVLFIPAVAWLWFRILRNGGLPWGRGRWLFPIIYFGIAALPSAIWFIYGLSLTAQRATSPLATYLLRTYEWVPHNWYLALQAAWAHAGEQAGKILWYPLLLVVVLSVALGKVVGFVRSHLEIFLLIVPWYAQLIFPISFFQNDAYTYPSLYGLALLLAVLLHKAVKEAPRMFGMSGMAKAASVILVALIILGSSLWDYRETYRAWYSPMYDQDWILQKPLFLITVDDPFASARQLRAINTTHQPVLADLPATLYYASDQYWQGQATWWWWGFGREDVLKMVESINSQQYTYVVFTYQPPVEIYQALISNHYESISPGLWERSK